MTGEDAFRTRIENTTRVLGDSFDVKSEIQLIDGLIKQRHTLLHEAWQSEMRMISAQFDFDLPEEVSLDEVLKQRRQEKLDEFERNHTETYHELLDAFDKQLERYYLNEDDRKQAISTLLIAVHEPTDLTIAALKPFFCRFRRVTSNRRFFVTADGRCGLGPSCLEDNDVVAILAGGSVPYVLRPVAGSYNFIGECYDGDFMKGGDLEGRKDSTLDTIRLQ
ncbi:hypothetical protein AA0112_g12427 [Alternaria arborescens]|nr:hypothetical protein AA0112_g12427 [Alternaria arborescens]